MSPLQIQVLFWLGVVCIVIGSCLMVWSTVNKRTAAGKMEAATGLFKAMAALVDAIGRLMPTAAGRVGFILVLVGLFLIIFPRFI